MKSFAWPTGNYLILVDSNLLVSWAYTLLLNSLLNIPTISFDNGAHSATDDHWLFPPAACRRCWLYGACKFWNAKYPVYSNTKSKHNWPLYPGWCYSRTCMAALRLFHFSTSCGRLHGFSEPTQHGRSIRGPYLSGVRVTFISGFFFLQANFLPFDLTLLFKYSFRFFFDNTLSWTRRSNADLFSRLSFSSFSFFNCSWIFLVSSKFVESFFCWFTVTFSEKI